MNTQMSEGNKALGINRAIALSHGRQMFRSDDPNQLNRGNTTRIVQMPGIRVKTAAARAARPGPERLWERALASDSKEWLSVSFSNIHPANWDVLICGMVYRDAIKQWVMSSSEAAMLRSADGTISLTSNTIRSWDRFLVEAVNLSEAIEDAYLRDMVAKGSLR